MLPCTVACRNAVLMSPILSFHPFAKDIARIVRRIANDGVDA